MKITRCERLERVTDGVDVVRIIFDDGKDSALCMWNYDDLVQYIGEEAIVQFRLDLWKGEPQRFVKTIAKVGVINTLERTENIRLYSTSTDNHCNVCFADISDGSTFYGAVIYVTDVKYSSSTKATWMDLTVLDQQRRLATLRLFNPDSKTVEAKGHYINCDIHRNQYGLSTETLSIVDSSFHFSPDVEIAENYIMQAFGDDPDMQMLLAESKFIEFAKKIVAEEPGYVLVRLALELDIANELANLQNDVSVALLKRCLLIDKFHVLQPASVYEKDIVTFVTCSRYQFQGKKQCLDILFSVTDCYSSARALLRQVKEMASAVIDVKKGRV